MGLSPRWSPHRGGARRDSLRPAVVAVPLSSAPGRQGRQSAAHPFSSDGLCPGGALVAGFAGRPADVHAHQHGQTGEEEDRHRKNSDPIAARELEGQAEQDSSLCAR